jgi:hypothetical protein
MLDEYCNRVVKRLSSGEGATPSRLADALCLPSFHPEVLLRVSEVTTGTTFRLATFTSSLWYSESGQEPGKVDEAIHVPPERAARFWDTIGELNPQTIRDGTTIGVDGMSARASWRQGKVTSSFEAWSPSPDSRHGKFIRRIYDLGWQVVRERVSIERLEQLHADLRLGLPARLIEGKVRCLRIFGSLSSSDEDDLRSFFAALPSGEPMVMDMTNFDSMGALLYPAFLEFASERRSLAWAVSEMARRHVDSMGLVQPQFFERAEDAMQWVARISG